MSNAVSKKRQFIIHTFQEPLQAVLAVSFGAGIRLGAFEPE